MCYKDNTGSFSKNWSIYSYCLLTKITLLDLTRPSGKLNLYIQIDREIQLGHNGFKDSQQRVWKIEADFSSPPFLNLSDQNRMLFVFLADGTHKTIPPASQNLSKCYK